MYSQINMPGYARKLVSFVAAAVFLLLLASIVSAPRAAADTSCEPTQENACLQGVIKTSAGEPASGVTLRIEAEGGEYNDVQTDSEGKWALRVTEPGNYTVTVDKATLPDGQFLKSVGTRELEVELNSVASGLFPLTDGSAGESPDTDEATGTARADTVSWGRFWQQAASGLRMGFLIALASLGLSLVFGTTGLSNFAQGEMVTIGGLLAALFMGFWHNLWLAGLLAVILSGLFGWAQNAVIWAPLRRRRLSVMQMMIVSIGLSIALQYTYQLFFGTAIIRIDKTNPSTVTVFGVTLTVQSYLAMGISLMAIIVVGLGLTYTRFGRATRAISDNPSLARASGINSERMISVVWTVSGALAGLAGVFFGLIFNGLTWFTGGQMLLLFFAAVTLGGLGTAFGAFVGSMIIGMVVELSNIWLPGDLKYASALLIMIVILLVRPQGIFGRKERVG